MGRKIIGLIGKAKSGKDTAAQHLVNNWNFKRVAFADKLKEICMDLFGLTEQQVNTQEGKESLYINCKTVRAILQETGNNLRDVYCDVWVDYLCKKIYTTDSSIVVSDVRYVNELTSLVGLDAKIIRIVRVGHTGLLGREAQHISEVALDKVNNYTDSVIEVPEGELQKLYDKLDYYVTEWWK
jgi:hypothetical protein